ncbi:protealysin inhibitor emfourin [Streptomyces sp. NPDC060048]|uniref:protealysin inhibitor emfourin n=1 Tax=unclassified Streptomyces TaxID=2593676 RepID=UPI0036CF5B63
MLITVSRSGGFAGVDKVQKIDTSARRDAEQWEDLARRVLPPVADGYHYRITVDDHVLELDETNLTGAQRELVRAVLGEGG